MEDRHDSACLRIMTVRFANKITPSEIKLFRGAVIHSMENTDILFHNHIDGDKFRYSYPLIQYKRIEGKASIVGIGEGTDALGRLIAKCNFDYLFGTRLIPMQLENVTAERIPVEVSDKMIHYQISQWLPLNEDNYSLYKNIAFIEEKMVFLEKILVGNILSMAKGLHLFFSQQISVKIIDILQYREIKYKGVKLQSFDVRFGTNVSLPSFIGLGKDVSLGSGTIVRL
jgi:hypothetical protein